MKLPLPYVYFIQAVGVPLVKIGKSWEPEKRLKELQVSAPFKLRLLGKIQCRHSKDSCAVERAIHAKLSAHRSHGEWFHGNAEVSAYIDGLMSGREPLPRMTWKQAKQHV